MNVQAQNNCERLVSRAIIAALASRNASSAQMFEQMYQEPNDQSIGSQIAAANAFWRMQLGMAPVCTTRVRECLQDCDLEQWLRLFQSEVASVIVELGLPSQLSASRMNAA